MPDPKPPNVPGGAPKPLRDFVNCTETAVVLEPGPHEWLPFPGTPEVIFEEGSGGGVNVIPEVGGVPLLPYRVSIDGGQLKVESSNPLIQKWVDDLNSYFDFKGMELGDLVLRDGKVHLTKQKVTAADEEAQAVAVEPPLVTAGTTPTPAQPQTPSSYPGLGPKASPAVKAFYDKHKAKFGVGAGALLLGVAGFFIFGDGNGKDQTPAVAAGDATDGSETTGTDSTPSSSEPGAGSETTGTDSTPSSSEADEGSASTGTYSISVYALYGGPDGKLRVLPEGEFGSFQEGQAFFATSGPPGNTVNCADGSPNTNADGADIIGLFATTQGDTATVAVPMAQSPMFDEDFSRALSLQAITTGGQTIERIWENHNNVRLIGQRDPSGGIVPGSELGVTLTDTAYIFNFEFDPNDPPALLFAQGFNSPSSDDTTGCDTVLAAADPFPGPPASISGSCIADSTRACLNNGRFEVQILSDGQPLDASGPPSDDGLVFTGSGGPALARVINGCDLTNHYWVFAAAATDVEYTLMITDTADSGAPTYESALGGVTAAITDTSAFATCP